jgi:hypothetical protein
MDRHPDFHRCACWLMLGLFVFTSAGCSASLFKVKPVSDLPALSASAKTVEAGGVRASVAPLLSDEESQELFEANLPLGGVLPLRIEVAYQPDHPNSDGSQGTPAVAVPLELKRLRLRLRDSEGREWKLLSTKKAIGRILKANGVYLYNPYSRKQFEKDFSAYAIDLKTPLPVTEKRRQGFLFFQTPDKSPVSSPRGLVLSISGVPQPLQITID